MSFQWTDGSTEGSDASLRSCVRSLLDFVPFLKEITFRYCSSATFLSSSFLKFFKNTLHPMLGYDRFSSNSSLEILVGANILFQWLWDFCRSSWRNGDKLCGDCERLLVTKYCSKLVLSRVDGYVKTHFMLLWNKIIPLKLVRFKDWTEKEWKSSRHSKRNFQRPSDSLENHSQRPLEKIIRNFGSLEEMYKEMRSGSFCTVPHICVCEAETDYLFTWLRLGLWELKQPKGSWTYTKTYNDFTLGHNH